jgi:hypothetical protein
MLFDQPSNAGDLLTAEPMTTFQPDGIEPEFGLAVVPFNVDMGRLRTITGVEAPA